MRREKSQGILPSVADARRTSPGHSQSISGHSPSSDGTQGSPLLVTAADGVPATALPAVDGGPSRSPSRRSPQVPSQHMFGGLMGRHVTSRQTASTSDGGSGTGSGRFYHTSAISGSGFGTSPVSAPADIHPGNSALPIEAAVGNVAAATAAPSPPPRAAATVEAPIVPSNGHPWEERPLPPTPPGPPAVTSLGITPHVVAGAGSRGCRRSLPNVGMGVGSPNGRPVGARRSLSPTQTEQPRITRMSASRGARTLSPGTNTASPYSPASSVLLDLPSSPGGQMQPRPPLQVHTPCSPLLEDPGASSPSFHAGALPSPRVVRMQLVPAAPLQPLTTSLKRPSSRQSTEAEDLPERMSCPERFSAGATSGAAAASAATANEASVAPVEGPTSGDSGGFGAGDTKQMSMLADLAAAVGELQRRVEEMSPRLPYDATGVSDTGSGYSWCTSTRSSAPGNVNGDSSSLSIGPWAPPVRGGVSSSGVSVVTTADRTMDERLSVLELQMKHLATAICDVAASTSAASHLAPPGSVKNPPIGTIGGGGNNNCPATRGAGGGPERLSQPPPPPGWSESDESREPYMHGYHAPEAASTAAATAQGLALGFLAAAAMRQKAPHDNGVAACPASAASLPRHRKRALPAGLAPCEKSPEPKAPGNAQPPAAEALPASSLSHNQVTEAAAVTVEAVEQLRAVAQQIQVMEGRLQDLEGTVTAQTDRAVAAMTAATAAALADEEEQRQRKLRAAVEEALTVAMQNAAPGWEQPQQQLEVRMQACEERVGQLQQIWPSRKVYDEAAQVNDTAAAAAPAPAAAAPAAAAPAAAAAALSKPVNAGADADAAAGVVKISTELVTRAVAATTTAAEDAKILDALMLGMSMDEALMSQLAAVEAAQEHGRKALPSALQDNAAAATGSYVLGDAANGAGTTLLHAVPSSAIGQSLRELEQRLQELMQKVQDVAMEVTSARAQSSSCAGEIQVILEQVRAVQATAAAANADAHKASTAALAAERAAAAALDVVDAAATAAKVTGNGLRRRSRSTSGGAVASSGGCAGGLQSPMRSEVWLAAPRYTAAPIVTVVRTRQHEPEDQVQEKNEDDTEEVKEEEDVISHSADAPPALLLPTRRLAARDVGFHIQPDGTDVAIGGVTSGATLYGISASRPCLLEAALARLSEMEAEQKDLRSKVAKALVLRVTRDELRESVAQLDLKIRSAIEDSGGAVGGRAGRAAYRSTSIGLRTSMSARARLSSDGGDAAGVGSGSGYGGDGPGIDAGTGGGEGATAAAAAGGSGVAAGHHAMCQGSLLGAAAPGQRVTAWLHKGRQVVTATSGNVSDGGINRGGNGGGTAAAASGVNAELSTTVKQLQRSVGLVEQRLEVVEASVTQCGAAQVALSVNLQQVQQQQLQAQLQLQLLQPPQDRAVTAPPQPYSRNGSVARRCGNAGGSATLGSDEQLLPMAQRMEINAEAHAELGRQVRSLVEQSSAATSGQGQARGRDLLRNGV